MADADNNRYERGMAFVRSTNPAAAEKLEAAFGDFAPDLMRNAAEYAFGDLYSREGLDKKIRQTATISALASLGHLPQLKIHLGIARSMGFTREEIVEILIQLTAYAGFPAAMNAAMVAKEVFGPIEAETNQ